MNYERPELMEHLAREYALGTLKGPARRRFKSLTQGSRRLAEAVEQWEARLAVMERAPVLVPAPLSAWPAIEQRLFAEQRRPDRSVLLEAARRWFSGRALGGVLTGMLVAGIVIQTVPAPWGLETASEALPASYVGVLAAHGGSPNVVVSSRRHGRLLTVKVLSPISVPKDQRATLWAIPKVGSPWVIGSMASSGRTQIRMQADSEQLFREVDHLAVSLESDTGQTPQTPSSFVLQGACVKVW